MHTIILGGGISGLSAAWFLHKRKPDERILLLEEKERLGGWIQTKREGEFCFERGPRTLARGRSTELLKLIDELGLTGEVQESLKEASGRYLLKGGKLRKLSSFWPELMWSGVREIFRPQKSGTEDESIYEFATRRFGERIARGFFDPLTLGIYAGDISRLSVRSCFPFFRELEKREGSVVWGMLKKKKGESGLFTLKGGLERLIHEMEKRLPIEVIKNCRVEELGEDEVVTSQGVFRADRIISALPAREMSRIAQVPLSLSSRSIWIVHVGFSKPLLKKRGFGYLAPTSEGENLLGMVWDSEIFSKEEQTRLTAMVREESENPVRETLNALKNHMGISEKPDYVSSHLAFQAIPQMEVGHEAKIAQFQEEMTKRFPRLILAGNYLTGVSLEACVARSRAVIDTI